MIHAEILAYGGEVQNDHGETLLAQAGGGSHHERRFAHLARGQHAAERAGLQPFVEVLVGLALDAARRVVAQRATGNVKAGNRTIHSRGRLRYVS